MKRLIIMIALVGMAILGIAMAPSAYAVDVLGPVCDSANPADKPAVCGDSGNGVTNPLLGGGGIFSAVARILSIAASISAVIIIVVAGLKIVLSNGDPATLATARKQIIYAVVGLAVIISANGIIALVLNRVTSG